MAADGTRSVMRAGQVPPPIEATQFADGTGRIIVSNGHRRHWAALQTGRKLPAWVSPVMPHPRGLIDTSTSQVMLVGMTYEAMTGLAWNRPPEANVAGESVEVLNSSGEAEEAVPTGQLISLTP